MYPWYRPIFQHANQINPTSSTDGMMAENFEIRRIFLQFAVLTQRSFLTIFCQLSNKGIKIKSSTSGAQTYVLQHYNLLLYLRATITFYLHRFISTIFSFVSTCLPFSLLCFTTKFVSISSVKVFFPTCVCTVGWSRKWFFLLTRNS
jgi:hypothetical protein